ncbi:MAG: DUF47 domain-containing protein [Haloferacaceae archaeon]
MAPATGAAFGERLDARTTACLERIDECVAALPRLLDRHADGEPHGRLVERIRKAESDCDREVRRINTLVSNAEVEDLGLGLTHLHLNAGATIDLYQRLDGIANAAEQFAEELAAIDPPRSPAVLDRLCEMAEIAARTVPVLARAVTGYTEALCDPYASVDLGGEIRRIRAAEDECDDLRHDAVAAAFADDAPAPTVHRELAHLLDAVVDAMEDVADRIVWITGTESWVEADLAARR